MKNKMKEKTSSSLSKYDQNVLLPILMKGLEMKKGKENAVTGKGIVYGLRNAGLRIDERRVCRLINHMRTNDLVVGLMASNRGYYITSNEEELIVYEESLLSREAALKDVRMSMQRQRRSMFVPVREKQPQLF